MVHNTTGDVAETKESLHAKIAELRRELALRDVEIAENKEEITKAATTFKTVLAMKNREIKNLKKEVENLRTGKVSGPVKNEGTVYHKIDPITASLNDDIASLKKSMKELSTSVTSSICSTENTIRARFEEISKLTSLNRFSEPLNLAGASWQICIAKENEYLAVYLKASDIKVRCAVFFEIQLISHAYYGDFHTAGSREASSIYEFDATVWGYSKFIKFEELRNSTKQYIEDDAILVAITIKAFPTKLLPSRK